MKIKALTTIIAFDGQMVVINKDESGELRDDLAQQEIDAGKAVKVKGKVKAEEAEPETPAAEEASAEEAAADAAP